MLPRELRKHLFQSRCDLEQLSEFVKANAGLPQDASESADRDEPVHRHRDVSAAFHQSGVRTPVPR